MENALIKPAEALPEVLEDQEASRKHYEASWAKGTVRAYRSDWRDWEAYCKARELTALPADPLAVAGYLSALAEGKWGKPRKISTIERRRAAISHIHIESGHPDPANDPRVPRVLKGIRRQLTVKREQKSALRADDVKRMVKTLGKDPRGMRDRALILLGFATACRRSELAGLQVSDLKDHRDGLVVEIRRSKTDQEGDGLLKLVRCGKDKATCPVEALRAWMSSACIDSGPVFRTIGNDLVVGAEPISVSGISLAVKRAARNAGLNASLFSAHSLRAGFVTEADARGAKTLDIMSQTGHKTTRMISVYTRYNVDERFESSTALDVGL
ncbi:site-specific integrase [bacterium]|nr:site-specific integrase [bacterium]